MKSSALCWWIAGSVAGLALAFALLFLAVEMTFAEPGAAVVHADGTRVVCEARAAQQKLSQATVCVAGLLPDEALDLRAGGGRQRSRVRAVLAAHRR
mgnify:CR=1 FL=1